MDIFKLLSHPLRMQILQYLALHERATTRQIASAISSASAPTVYRHVNALLAEGILAVAERREVRGSTERVLCVNAARFTETSAPAIAGIAWQYAMSLNDDFARYAKRSDADPVRDLVALSESVLFVTDAEFTAFLQELAALVSRYVALPAQTGATLRKVAIATVPVDNE